MRRVKAFLALALAAAVIFIAEPAAAQTLGQAADPLRETAQTVAEGGFSKRIIQMFLMVTVLSLAPGIAMMVTCLPFMLIVLSILRQGVGLQQAPPNMLIVSVAIFLTYFVMEPVFKDAWSAGIQPLLDGTISEASAFALTMEPFRMFMEARVDPGAVDILMDARPIETAQAADGATPLSMLVPAFVLSEIQRAFEIGFIVLLPFLVIDLLVASILMAMGMMMVPPAIVSLPFKVAFFVLTNGWVAVSGALVRGYS
ncbi:flagellar type III secretion system pore protein FliP [Hyphococcus luteus]|uniref:Flagellar biosynthetic protein FliP n=1 Tax=Hyphococcus luteus TaxID=2058213 RepID=A0A2S7K4K7_9PROT|nr:flagellar type III secretion system pore protein FliP [Marinicaulis flavus]PQA87429.1 flagellar biosynthetic protein FliP [Marinicaulis flavus]